MVVSPFEKKLLMESFFGSWEVPSEHQIQLLIFMLTLLNIS